MTWDHTDADACYRAVASRDRRFDGVFFTAVRSTGIYCRPSCPARTPARRNVTFHPTAASAQGAGYRACKRCRPDALPGSPGWDLEADVAGRAMRLIADGVVDRDGVPGLARRLGYTPRHLSRVLTRELGAGPLALTRARRAQVARTLVESTDLRLADVAFAAGFGSVRQFNETLREVYGVTPSELRGARGRAPTPGRISLRLAVRTPFAGRALLEFLAARTVPGVEETGESHYARTMRLPHGTGVVRVELDDLPAGSGTAFVDASFRLDDLRDTSAAVERTRRLLDADADPRAVLEAFADDPVLGPVVMAEPGLRVPGHVDGDEIAVRAVLGQQISVARARALASDLTDRLGEPLPEPDGELWRLFPAAVAFASVDPTDLPMPRARGRALVGLCDALADGRIELDRGADRRETRSRLLELSGIGPWTADYIALRALGDPDVFLPGDVGTRHALARLGAAEVDHERWRPWRSYAQVHLWRTLSEKESS